MSDKELIASLIEKHLYHSYGIDSDYTIEDHKKELEGFAGELYDLLAPKWMSVEDRQPKQLQEVLFTNINLIGIDGSKIEPTVKSGFYRSNHYYSWLDPRDIFKATHWMPLPTPPKEKP